MTALALIGLLALLLASACASDPYPNLPPAWNVYRLPPRFYPFSDPYDLTEAYTQPAN